MFTMLREICEVCLTDLIHRVWCRDVGLGGRGRDSSIIGVGNM